ncbi:MAG: sugar ABC transporter permease, partial [Spirochaetota bacterium]
RLVNHKGWNMWILPAVILCFAISLFPWLIMIYNSFFSLSYTDTSAAGFAGLENYRKAFSDPGFINSIWVTFKFLIFALPLEFLIGLALAVLVARHIRMRKFVVPIIIIPMIISPSVVGLIWKLNLDPSFGLVGILLKNTGIFTDALLGAVNTVLPTIIAIDVWQWTPFIFLLVLAGILGQSKEPYEAAQVDGATFWQTFLKITIPLLKPIFIVALLLRFTDAYKVFDQIWIMTTGGPGRSSESLSIFGYRLNFKYWHIGYGSAVITLFFIISFIASFLFVKAVVPPEKKIT